MGIRMANIMIENGSQSVKKMSPANDCPASDHPIVTRIIIHHISHQLPQKNCPLSLGKHAIITQIWYKINN